MKHHKQSTQYYVVVKNKQASFLYTLFHRYTAGMVLTGTEIKSIRAGKASLKDAYCYFSKGELWMKDMHIATYTHGHLYNHVEKRTRKLLLHRAELNKLMRNKEKGLTIIPLQLFINERGLAKIEIALAKGKKDYDKRQKIKERDLARAMQKNQL